MFIISLCCVHFELCPIMVFSRSGLGSIDPSLSFHIVSLHIISYHILNITLYHNIIYWIWLCIISYIIIISCYTMREPMALWNNCVSYQMVSFPPRSGWMWSWGGTQITMEESPLSEYPLRPYGCLTLSSMRSELPRLLHQCTTLDVSMMCALATCAQ